MIAQCVLVVAGCIGRSFLWSVAQSCLERSRSWRKTLLHKQAIGQGRLQRRVANQTLTASVTAADWSTSRQQRHHANGRRLFTLDQWKTGRYVTAIQRGKSRKGCGLLTRVNRSFLFYHFIPVINPQLSGGNIIWHNIKIKITRLY